MSQKVSEKQEEVKEPSIKQAKAKGKGNLLLMFLPLILIILGVLAIVILSWLKI